MSVFLSAAPAVAGGNHYPKYTTRNPLARRLVDGFMAALADLAERSGAKQVHEVGCGEGFLSTMLAQSGLAVRGSDISAAAVAIARQRAAALGLPVTIRVADLHDLSPPDDGAELVVCCEVLEHLADPARARAARPPGAAAPDRQRAPRAALARAERGARSLLGCPRQHARPSPALVGARLSCPARRPPPGA